MLTITEALAEIATLDKRIPKKDQAMRPYVARVEAMKDPFAKQGGSEKFLREERQSFNDLLKRKVELRRLIAEANAKTTLVIDGEEQTVADWLVWKRECYKPYVDMLKGLLASLQNARNHSQQHGVAMVRIENEAKPDDVIVNLDEQALIAEIDAVEEKYGRLDGLLSLKNATTTI